MNSTLFLGVATALNAFGAFLASRQHLYAAYVFLVLAVVMVILAIWTAYRNEYRLKRGRRELGRVLVELSQCALAAHRGNSASDYDKLRPMIDKVKNRVAVAAKYLDDSSVESRFLAVNVLDVQLDQATKEHFIGRGQGSFWTVYQQINGWRACIERLLQELRR